MKNTLTTRESWGGVAQDGSYDSAAPLFTDAANGDYTLAANSQALDVGDDSVVKDGDLDLAGYARIVGEHVDLGAYELRTSTSSVLDEAFAEIFVEDLDW